MNFILPLQQSTLRCSCVWINPYEHFQVPREPTPANEMYFYNSADTKKITLRTDNYAERRKNRIEAWFKNIQANLHFDAVSTRNPPHRTSGNSEKYNVDLFQSLSPP